MSSVTVVQTGLANIASIKATLQREGRAIELTKDPDRVYGADHLVLPGVGAFGPGMQTLKQAGIVEALRERIHNDRPTLAICLGLQLLCEASDENPSVEGIGIIPATVKSFDSSVISPHFGWNMLETEPNCALLETGFVYYANSFRLASPPPGWFCAYTEHGGRFCGGLERGSVLACQFHPELSGSFGSALLRRWLTKGGSHC